MRYDGTGKPERAGDDIILPGVRVAVYRVFLDDFRVNERDNLLRASYRGRTRRAGSVKAEKPDFRTV